MGAFSDRACWEIVVAIVLWGYCAATTFSRFHWRTLARILATTGLLLLFLAPYRIQKIDAFVPITIVLDDSLSMTRPLDDGTTVWSRSLEFSAALEAEARRRGIDVAIRTTSGLALSHIADASRRAPESVFSPLRGLARESERAFVFSDGIERARSLDSPTTPSSRAVDAVVIGSASSAFDRRIEAFSAPRTVFSQNGATLRATLGVVGAEPGPCSVLARLSAFSSGSESREVWTERVPLEIDASGAGSVEFSRDLSLDEPGRRLYRFEIFGDPDFGSERDSCAYNDSVSFEVVSRKGKLNVLLIDDEPSCDFRYLRETLRREETIALRTILFSADPRARDADATTFPFERFNADELSKFDVVLVGNVPDSRWDGRVGALTDVVLGKAGSTSLWLFGGGPAPDGRLAPGESVDGAESLDAGADGAARGWRVRATPAGRRVYADLAEFWTTLDSNPNDASVDALELTGIFPNVAPGVDTETLLVARREGDGGDIPLALVASPGRSKIIWFASDEIWRMRTVEDKEVYRRFVLRTLDYLTADASRSLEEETVDGELKEEGEEERRALCAEASDVSARIDALSALAESTKGEVLDLRDRANEDALESARAFFARRLDATSRVEVERRQALAPPNLFVPLVLAALVALLFLERRR